MLPFLSGARPSGNPDRESEGVGLLIHSGNPDRFLTLMRAGILPFFLLACLVVFFWTRHTFGKSRGRTGDSPVYAGAAGAGARRTGHYRHGPGRLPGCGLLRAHPVGRVAYLEAVGTLRPRSASAVLCKFTALGYLPAAAVFALLAWGMVTKPGSAQLAQLARERATGFLLAAATGVVTIWAAYYFSFGPMPGGGASLPAPEFFDGIRSALRHNSEGHPSYLLGRNGNFGWWYYFPVALAVKTPIAFLILSALGAWLCIKRRAQAGALLPLAFVLGILLPAMAGHVNIGVRHILPIYMGLSIIAAAGLIRIAQTTAVGALALVLWMAISGALSHPDYLAYFNEFAGSEPEKVLVDSDLDWGQSTKPLARRLKQLGATEVNFGVRNGAARTWKSGRACPRSNRSTPPCRPRAGPPSAPPSIRRLSTACISGIPPCNRGSTT